MMSSSSAHGDEFEALELAIACSTRGPAVYKDVREKAPIYWGFAVRGRNGVMRAASSSTRLVWNVIPLSVLAMRGGGPGPCRADVRTVCCMALATGQVDVRRGLRRNGLEVEFE